MNAFRALLIGLVSTAAIAAPVTVQLGSHAITTEAVGDRFTVSYTAYERYRDRAWAYRRYHPDADPLGPRPYWNLPLAQPLREWQDDADLTGDVFTASLDAKTIAGWHRLALADDIVLEYLIEHPLRDFLLAHAGDVEKVRAGFGKTVLLADFWRAPVDQRDQYVFNQAVVSLHRAATFFNRSYQDELLHPERIAPRIAKLGDAPYRLSEPTLIVVHATTVFDEQETAKAGIDALVARFKQDKHPVVYLMTDSGDEDLGWYTADRQPTFALFSDGGEHNLGLDTDDVTVAGGFFGDYDGGHGCQFKAMVDAISRHFVARSTPLRVHLPLHAIYYYDDDLGMFERYLAGKTEPLKFVKDVEGLLLFADDETVMGMGEAETGGLSTSEYTFTFSAGGKTLDARGTGARRVEFIFE